MIIKLKGNIPPKKNSRINTVRGGRIMSFPSKRYTDWHKDAMLQLKEQGVPQESLSGVYFEIQLYAKDKRKKDSSNVIESIFDLLVDYGFLKDDSWWDIISYTVKPVILDKVGGAEIKVRDI